MPNPGMTGRWPGFATPLVALLVTLSLTWFYSAVVAIGDSSSAVASLGLLVLMPSPIVVSVVWGGALLLGRPHRLALAGAALWFVICWLVLPHEMVWQYLGNVVAGLLAGVALGMRWRPDLALAAMALVMAPLLIFAAVEMPIEEHMQLTGDSVMEMMAEGMPSDLAEAEKDRLLRETRRSLDSMKVQLTKMYPFVLAVGALGQSAIILVLVWLLAKAGGQKPRRWALPPFTEWRLPFYLVWLLVVGLGMSFVHQPALSKAGYNLALLAAFILSVQGLAIQVYVTRRTMGTLRQVIYWVILGTILVKPGIFIAVALGVVDQWWDIRRLATRNLTGNDDNDDATD